MSFKYKNVSELEQSVMGVGLIKPGEEFDTDLEIHNSNFTRISGQTDKGHVTGEATVVSEPAHIPPEAQENQEQEEIS